VDVLGAATALASPKSTTLTVPSAETNTFSGLTSRCTSPARCAAASAASTGSSTETASSGRSRPRRRSTSRSVLPADQLHHQEHDPAGRGLLGTLVEHGDRVGVRQPGRGARLPDEPLGERRVVRQRGRGGSIEGAGG
jgi:hypothetical protein